LHRNEDIDMKKRVTLQAVGEVQKVGYRDFVQKVARKLGVVGTVENMRDGSVQVVCEGDESVIAKFQKAIKVKKDFIDVENVSVVKTGKAAGKFEYFDIKYGSPEEELGERMGAGILYMAATRDEVKASRKDNKAMHADLKGGFKDTKEGLKQVKNEVREMHTDLKNDLREGFGKVEGAVKGMHGDMNTRFDTLDTKYGEIGTKMNDLTTELQKSTNALVAMTEKVGALIDRKLAE
jgi:acylphosphatase